jgi:hypothetical protein
MSKILILFSSSFIFSIVFANQESIGSQIPIKLDTNCELLVTNDNDLRSCLKDMVKEWSTYDKSLKDKYECCFNWEIIDCQEVSVRKLCNDSHVDDFRLRKSQWIQELETQNCDDFKYGQTYCRFPVWIISVIAVAFMIVFIILCIAICLVLMRKRAK